MSPVPPIDAPPDPLAAVRQPMDRANGLPNAHYIDPDVYAEERDALIFGQWAGIGVAAQAPDPGDAFPVDFMGMPLLMLRDRGGVLRVFQNTCRHRGMILVDAPGNIAGALRCPYHSWCYATDGRLIATPHVGGPGQNLHPAIERDSLGLVELRNHVWRDVVWVNVSGKAPPFEQAMTAVIAHMTEVERPLFHGGADSHFELTVRCNWKLAVENYCESYHLPWVHPGLNSYSRLEDHYHIEHEGKFSGQGSHAYRPLRGEAGERFPDFANLSARWRRAAEYPTVYPNVLFGVHRDHAYAIILLPQGPEKTVEQVNIYYSGADTDPGLRARNTAQWREVFHEDVAVVEGMQKGRHAVHFDGGRFSPAMDGPTHCFHDWVAAQMQKARGGQPGQ